MVTKALQRSASWAIGACIAITCGACGDSTGSSGSSARDAEVLTLKDLPLPDAAMLAPDVAVLRDCEDGATRPCGTDEGECIGGIEHCVNGLWDAVCAGSAAPIDERCNTLDDDCDGRTDEGFRIGVTCKFTDARGIQRDGVQQCDGESGGVTCVPGMDCRADDDADGVNVCEDCDDADPTAYPEALELCDGIDNDCNQRIDESFPLDEACTSGEGVCRRGGRYRCGDAGELACSAEPGPPEGPELCGDATDNDCDGETDEGFDLGAACAVGVGACVREGVLVCGETGEAAICDAVPAAPGEELCGNALDDDCDGSVDEDFALGLPCDVGLGACARTGVLLCDAATGLTLCNVAAGVPVAELCGNRVDDDCDGETDEGYAVGVACSVGEGECLRNGMSICTRDGRGTTCNVEPGAPHDELCGTQVDEDCDGLVDEDFDAGIVCTSGLGECARLGVMECTLNRLGTSCGAEPGPPALEICNGLDDDCDGETDEGFNVGGACADGVGACRRDGVIGCDVQGQLYCRAQAAPPGQERCGNQEDDDCDGQTDEGFDVGDVCTTGIGVCAATGRKVCDFDALGTVCDAQPGVPRPEVCGNGLDDDCDGTSDDGFDVGAPCAVGVGTCRRAGAKICAPDGITTTCNVVPGLEQTELCGTGQDEDCDGRADEGFDVGAACSAGVGECLRRGQAVCGPDGLSTVCGAAAGVPAAERCDNLDNNCNGRVDDGFNLGAACTSGVGPCRVAGTQVCRPDGAGTQCNAVPLPPQPELCDSIDNDCDGQTDEDFPDLDGPCDSPADADLCTLGAYACELATGAQICVGDVAVSEVCNYRDDDCDGVPDNGFDLESDENNCGACGTVCPAPYGTCLRGVCYRQYWVDDDTGSDTTGVGSRQFPWRTLTHALSGPVIGPRAVISILPGLYTATMHPTEFEVFPITMRDGVEVEGFGALRSVVFDAALRNGVLRATNLRDVNNRIENLLLERGGIPAIDAARPDRAAITLRGSIMQVIDVTMQNGNGANFAAGVAVTPGTGGAPPTASVTCTRCVFANNTSNGNSMIVEVTGAGNSIVLDRCDFHGNSTQPPSVDQGAMVQVTNARAELINTAMANNAGNGIRMEFAGSDATVTNCSFAGNSGSGIVFFAGSLAVYNSIFYANQRYGMFEPGALFEPRAFWNNLFFNNTLANYYDENTTVRNTAAAINAAAGASGRGTVVADPNIFSLPAGNLRLRVGSPAIDAADSTVAPALDYDGDVRPRGAGDDIGFDEF
jgi:hypothetical protein